MSNEIRIESKMKNNKLWKETVGKYGSVYQFCIACWGGIKGNNSVVGDFLNLKKSPYLKREGGLQKHAKDIVSFTGIHEDILFPPRLYDYEGPKFKVQEVNIQKLDEIGQYSYQIEQDTIDKIEQKEIYNLVKQRIYSSSSLIDKDKYFTLLKHRFGLNGSEPMDLEEVGRKLNLSKERVRQMEAKILRILRTPGTDFYKGLKSIYKENYQHI